MLALSVSSVFLGTAAAALRGNMEFFPATLALIFAVFLQTSAQLSAAHFQMMRDRRSSQDNSVNPDESDLTPPQILKEGSLAFLIVALTAGFSLMAMSGWWTLLIGALTGICFMLDYMIRKPLSRTPWALLITFILFGPVGVMGSSIVQSAHESMAVFNLYDITPAIFTSVIGGLYAINVNLLRDCLECDNDRIKGRHTICTIFGFKATKVFMIVSSVAICAVCWISCIYLKIDYAYLDFIIPAVSFVFNMVIVSKIKTGSSRATFAKLLDWGLLNMLVFSVLTWAIFWFVGIPDDSTLYIF